MPKKSIKKKVQSAKSRTSGFNRSLSLVSLAQIDKKLDILLETQQKLLRGQNVIAKDEEKIELLEENELSQEKQNTAGEQVELTELKKIEALETELKQDVAKSSPLRKITYRDITKGMIGAFFGVVSHYAFVEGSNLSTEFTLTRSITMYVVSLILLVVFLYFSGFRQITDEVKYKFLPLRAFVIYVSAIITAYLVLLLFDTIHITSTFPEVFRIISPISVLAVLGAATADLIGKNEE